MRGFFVGRFQPFHLGHRTFVEDIAADVDEIVIGIGSAQTSHTADNPFTAGERISMIHRSVTGLATTTFVVPIEDLHRNSVWVSHVTATVPPFDVAYSNNPLVRRLFEEAGFEVRSVELYQREAYSGTEVRRRMLAGEPWRHLVPDPVATVVDETNGVERLERVSDQFDE
ncbi:nicotinamide-nucleotide adenylyltransferase [Natronorubrum aibiense]|uniref:Nicotinamide-nucleotide adenylyltransferase n=1 Tax=Natronorubrum aibiense TaxID=348826 RepID=A0A5P9P8Y9_9EURY|nr:nicotinamide-nucleotide adenylyltransferase [Natronorubrum aibiense]QFU84621.1 nicotinamide-nucleotide adenylyltransferase [Natronorubrum aibiense]